MAINYFDDKAVNPPRPRQILVLQFCYPGLPPWEFNPNARIDRFEKNTAKNLFQDDIRVLILEQKSDRKYDGEMVENPVVSIKWGLPDKRRRDWDNLVAMSKPLIDSLVHLGVIKDDTVRHYQPRYSWVDSPKNPFTEIKVYRREYDN